MRCDLLYVSPHPDDAVFSSGGAIALAARAGKRVVVATVFSAVGEATEAVRSAEDAAAVKRLGAELVRLGFPDAPVRDPRYRRPAALFGALDDRDRRLANEVGAALAAYARASGASHIVGPLGVGEHIDHQIVHAACAAWDGDVAFYEDVPYIECRHALARRLARLGGEVPAFAARARRASELRALLGWWNEMPLLRDAWSAWTRPAAVAVLAWAALREPATASDPPPGRLWRGETLDISAALDDKLAAIAAYRSQWPLFHASLGEWRRAFAAGAREAGSPTVLERRWRRAP